MEDIIAIEDILQKFKSATEVYGVALATTEGLVVASILPQDVDKDSWAAFGASIAEIAKEVSNNFEIGNYMETLISGDVGRVITLIKDELILLTYTEISSKWDKLLDRMKLDKIREKMRMTLDTITKKFGSTGAIFAH